MKKYLTELMQIAPGRVSIEIDKHKLFNETAETVIEREVKQFCDTSPYVISSMMANDTIIHLEVAPITKPMPIVEIWHYDLELAMKESLKQIKKWKPEKK